MNILRQLVRFFPVVILVVGSAARSSAATFGVTNFSDAMVTTGPAGNLVNSNYGGAGAISISATGLPQGEFQSVLQFNLANAVNSFNTQLGVGQWSIQSATLQLTAANP